MIYDVAVIGEGPAGMTAAIYATRAGLSVVVLERMFAGGQMSETPEIDNFPGFESISGFELSDKMSRQAKNLGAEIRQCTVTDIDFSEGYNLIRTSSGEIESKTVVLALGAAHRHLDAPGEDKFQGLGVSYCATCDGNFFRGKTVAVVGGGESAFEETEYLSEICDKVYLIHRRDIFTAAKTAVDSVLKKKNVTVLTNSVIEEIKGESAVSSIVLKNRANGSTAEIPLAAVFVAPFPDGHRAHRTQPKPFHNCIASYRPDGCGCIFCISNRHKPDA